MPIIHTVKKHNPFVQIDKRPLNDPELSWAAKGLLAYLLSKPTHWEVIISDIIKRATDGRDSVYTILRELIDRGYVTVEKTREKGRFQTKYCVFELPVGSTDTASPERSDRYGETDTSNNDYSNNDYSNKELNTPSQKNAKVPTTTELENLPIEWQIQAGIKEVVTSEAKERKAQMIDSANTIAMVKSDSALYRNIALSFMQTRDIVIPFDACKKQRVAIKEMIGYGVTPEHVIAATESLMKKGMTVTDLHSIKKTAADLANQKDANEHSFLEGV